MRTAHVIAAIAIAATAACACGRDVTSTGPVGPAGSGSAATTADAGADETTDAEDAAPTASTCTTEECRAAEYERRCNERDAVACNNLGAAYNDGDGVPKDVARARAIWTEGCDEGFATACFNLANLDWGRDKKTWQAQMTRGCDLKGSLACVRLGEAHASGDLGAIDHTRAAALFERACDLGRASGCELFAQALRDGRGVPADAELAKEMERRACEILHNKDQGGANCF